VGRCSSRGDPHRDGGARRTVMSTDEPNPRCCSECVHYRASQFPDRGECWAPTPWWLNVSDADAIIHLPETLAENCPCFLPKP
jgi:hypothetical protein